MKNIPSKIDGIKFTVLNDKDISISSREIAEEFEKQHRDVKRIIDSYDMTEPFYARNFTRVEYTDKKGEVREEYEIKKGGYMMLVMGFTGAKAKAKRIKIIEAFEQMEAFIKEEIERRKERAAAAMKAPEMTDALLEHRREAGKITKPFHYANEFNMINRIVLGVPKKEWCESVGISTDDNFRDALSPAQIEAVENLQTVNTVLIETGLEYKDRKKKLDKIYNKKFAKRCLDEMLKLCA